MVELLVANEVVGSSNLLSRSIIKYDRKAPHGAFFYATAFCILIKVGSDDLADGLVIVVELLTLVLLLFVTEESVVTTGAMI